MTPKEALSELKALKPRAKWTIGFSLQSTLDSTTEDWTIDCMEVFRTYREYWEGETLEEVMEKVRKGLKPS